MSIYFELRKLLENNKSIEETLKDLDQLCLRAFGECILFESSLEYVTFKDFVSDEMKAEKIRKHQQLTDWMEVITEIAKEIVQLPTKGNDNQEAVLQKLITLRNEFEVKVKALMAYGDFTNQLEYEWVRISADQQAAVKTMETDVNFAKEIVKVIFEVDDTMSIRDLLKFVYAQLPVRMTSGRFYRLLDTYFEKFKGLNQEDVQVHQQLIWESFYPEGVVGFDDAFQPLSNIMRGFRKPSGETEAVVGDFELLENCIDEKNEILDIAIQMVAVVNQWICLLSLVREDNWSTFEQRFHDYELLMTDVIHADGEIYTEPVLFQLSKIEGVLEKRLEEINELNGVLEYALEHQKEAVLSQDLLQKFKLYQWSNLFMGQNFFPPLSPNLIKTQLQSDDYYLNGIKKQLFGLMDGVFANDSIEVKRSRMAGVIGYMNIIHTNPQEIYQFIEEALRNCGDDFEKAMCIKTIREGLEVLIA